MLIFFLKKQDFHTFIILAYPFKTIMLGVTACKSRKKNFMWVGLKYVLPMILAVMTHVKV